MARRKRRVKKGSAGGCGVSLIKFKTKRGKTISFRGRAGGQEKSGGKCSNKARRITAHMRAFGRAGKKCAKVGKPGSTRNSVCMEQEMKKQ